MKELPIRATHALAHYFREYGPSQEWPPTDEMLRSVDLRQLSYMPNFGRVSLRRFICYCEDRGIFFPENGMGNSSHRQRFRDTLNEMFDDSFTVKVIMDAYDKTREQ